MEITLTIQRFNPEKDSEPYIESFALSMEPTARVLDALVYLARNRDGSLTFRKSCAHGICGSDAVLINGKERLACKTLIGEVAEKDGAEITVEPLHHLRVEKDLIVDQSAFLEKMREVKPFFLPKEPPPNDKEYLQTQEERQLFDDATKCISCAACFSACPILEKNKKFLGPAALVQAGRFVFDSRDEGLFARLDLLDSQEGVWGCEGHFECTRVCPRGIKVTKLINHMKQKIKGIKASKEYLAYQKAKKTKGGAV